MSVLRRTYLLDTRILPRNLGYPWERQFVVDSLIKASIPRTELLLKSLNELEREIWVSISKPKPRDEIKSLILIFP